MSDVWEVCPVPVPTESWPVKIPESLRLEGTWGTHLIMVIMVVPELNSMSVLAEVIFQGIAPLAWNVPHSPLSVCTWAPFSCWVCKCKSAIPGPRSSHALKPAWSALVVLKHMLFFRLVAARHTTYCLIALENKANAITATPAVS